MNKELEQRNIRAGAYIRRQQYKRQDRRRNMIYEAVGWGIVTVLLAVCMAGYYIIGGG